MSGRWFQTIVFQRRTGSQMSDRCQKNNSWEAASSSYYCFIPHFPDFDKQFCWTLLLLRPCASFGNNFSSCGHPRRKLSRSQEMHFSIRNFYKCVKGRVCLAKPGKMSASQRKFKFMTGRAHATREWFHPNAWWQRCYFLYWFVWSV